MMTWDGTERRRHRRYGVKESTVRYWKGGALGWLRAPSPTYLLLNISLSGCHFITREELAPGQKLRLVMDAPVLRRQVRATGRVVWCRRSVEHEAWRVGLEFVALRGYSSMLLKNLLDTAILDHIEITTRQYLKQIEKL